MRTRLIAALGLASIVAASTASAQDLSGAMVQQFHEQMRPQQESLHNDARDFRDLSGAQLGKIIGDYRKATEMHRQNAVQIAEQARTNPLPPGTGARIRDALEADLTLWYNSVPVTKRDWEAMRKQWLLPVASLSDQQWALQRASWFNARDAWLDKRLQEAMLVRH